MRLLWLAFVVTVAALPKSDRLPLELANVLDGTFRARGLNAVWASGHQLAWRNSDSGDIELCHAHNMSCNVIVNNSTLEENGRLNGAGNWQLSSDLNLLLWSYDVQSGFRHSFQAKYSIRDINGEKWIDLDSGNLLDTVLLAPEGNGVAYVYEKNIYYVTDILANDQAAKITTDGSETIYYGVPDWVYEEEVLGSGSAMWFSSDGSHLAYAKFDDTNVKEFKFVIYGEDEYINVASLRYPKPGTTNPTVSLFILDLHSKAQFELSTKAFAEPILQHVSWTDEDTVVVVWMSRTQNAMVIETASKSTDWTRIKVLEDSEPNGWLEVGRPLPVNTSSWLQLLSERSAEGFARPTVVIDGKQSFRDDSASVATAMYGWNTATGRIFFQAAPENNPAQRHVYSVSDIGSVDRKCLTCSMEQLEPMETCLYASASFSTDLSHVAVTCSGPGPAVVRLATVKEDGTFDWGDDWEKNQGIRDLLKIYQLPVIEPNITFTVGDDVTAQARLWLPPNLDKTGNEKYPMLVYVYGGPGSQQVSEAFSINWGSYLATTKNIIYAFIDGRGSGYQGSKTLYALYKKLGTVEVEDQIDVARKLVEKFSFIDAERVGIWGWSYGGYATAMALAKDGGDSVFKCGASVAPVTSWRLYDSIYTERYMDIPDENKVGYEEASILDKIDLFNNHSFFLLHGNADDNVHYQHAMRLARALEKHNMLFYQQSYPDEDHSIRSVLQHVYMSLGQFFDDCFESSAATALPTAPLQLPLLLALLLLLSTAQ